MDLIKLKIGKAGEDVAHLHERLKLFGFPVSQEEENNKMFGSSTRAAIIRFQKKRGILGTGVITSETLELLDKQPQPNQPPNTLQRRVAGRVLLEHGMPADKVKLRFYNREFGNDTKIGEIQTDDQ